MKRPEKNKSKLWEIADLYRQFVALEGLLIEFLRNEVRSNDGKVVPLKRPNKPRPSK